MNRPHALGVPNTRHCTLQRSSACAPRGDLQGQPRLQEGVVRGAQRAPAAQRRQALPRVRYARRHLHALAVFAQAHARARRLHPPGPRMPGLGVGFFIGCPLEPGPRPSTTRAATPPRPRRPRQAARARPPPPPTWAPAMCWAENPQHVWAAECQGISPIMDAQKIG